MEQQQAPFNELPSYDARHEEAPQYSGYFPDSRQQKLSPQQQFMAPTAGQTTKDSTEEHKAGTVYLNIIGASD